jgi:hypothetical protein
LSGFFAYTFNTSAACFQSSCFTPVKIKMTIFQ